LIELTEDNFEATLRKGPVLVQFYADWHGACQKFEPAWRDLADALVGQIAVGRINFNEQRGLTERFGVATLPTFKFIYGEGIAVGYQGNLDAAQLRAYALTLLRPQVLRLSTVEDLSLLSLPHSAFILFHQAQDSSAMEAFIAGIRPFAETAGVLFAHSHSSELAHALAQSASSSSPLPPLPFVMVVKDWDLASAAPLPAVLPLVVPHVEANTDSTEALVEFLRKHWMPLVPRLDAASAGLQARLQPEYGLGVVVAVTRDAQQASAAFVNLVRNVASEYLGGAEAGGARRLAFAWLEGPRFEQWLLDFQVDDRQFGSHVFVLDSARQLYYPGVSVRSEEDLRGYIKRIESGSIRAQRMVDHKKRKKAEAGRNVLVGVVEDWVDVMQLPDWWKPSWNSTSPNMPLYLSLVLGLLFSLALLVVNNRIRPSPNVAVASNASKDE
jgi:thiol-disulfide isomerase/thioredoxin